MNYQSLQNIYTKENNTLLSEHQTQLERLIPVLVNRYYELLMSREETAKFLTNELVENRLQTALGEWLSFMLSPKTEDEIDQAVQRLKQIGQVHARINVEMSLVSEAMMIIKNSLFNGLTEEANYNKEIIRLVGNILDYSLIHINQIYFTNFNQIEHQSHVLRNNLSNMDFALEIEQMRNALNEWLTHGLVQKKFTPICETDFALWIKHKLSIVVSDEEGFQQVEALLNQITNLIENISTSSEQDLRALTQTVKDLSWNLSEHSKRLVANAEKKDPLTKLYNRRFIDSIFLQQTMRAQKFQVNYSVIMIDIDHFKTVNDNYGHDAGDRVLTKFGEIISHNIRVSDFAFRFGGEEFLILVTECSAQKATHIVDKISKELKEQSFPINDDFDFHVTLSAGIAEFDGQPDYEHTIKKADKALYQSKENGRDQHTIWTE